MNTSNGYIYNCKYYFIFSSYHHYPLFKNGDIKKATHKKIIEMEKEGQFQLLEFKTWPDTIYLKVQVIPDVSPLSLMKHIKQQTAMDIKKQFPEIKKAVPTIWPKRGIITTNSLSEKIIEQYRNNID